MTATLFGCSGDETTAPVEPTADWSPWGQLALPAEPCAGADLVHAPPNFTHDGEPVVFVDIGAVDASLELDIAAATARVSATVVFYQADPGYPVIDLVPAVDGLVVDGTPADPADFVTIPDPDDESELSLIAQPLQPGVHIAELDYRLPASPTLTFAQRSVDYFVDLSDWEPRHYLEKHFPSNFTYDAYPFELHIDVTGGTDHWVFANGEVHEPAPNSFDISFPAFFNSTCPFLHVLPTADYAVVEDVFAGTQGDIALTVYAKPAELSAEQWREGPGALALQRMAARIGSLEVFIGPYLYPSLLVRLETATWLCDSCGMEHAGATATTEGALGHEIMHSWFGRGMLPANGNAEWIDEAVCVWADRTFPRAESLYQYPSAKMSGFSPYRRHVPIEVYEVGPHIMAMLDFHFADRGGLLLVLQELYESYAGRVITTEDLLAFLNERSSISLNDFFYSKVYVEPG